MDVKSEENETQSTSKARTIVPKIGEYREPEKRNLVRKKVKLVYLVGQQGKALKNEQRLTMRGHRQSRHINKLIRLVKTQRMTC